MFSLFGRKVKPQIINISTPFYSSSTTLTHDRFSLTTVPTLKEVVRKMTDITFPRLAYKRRFQRKKLGAGGGVEYIKSPCRAELYRGTCREEVIKK